MFKTVLSTQHLLCHQHKHKSGFLSVELGYADFTPKQKYHVIFIFRNNYWKISQRQLFTQLSSTCFNAFFWSFKVIFVVATQRILSNLEHKRFLMTRYSGPNLFSFPAQLNYGALIIFG